MEELIEQSPWLFPVVFAAFWWFVVSLLSRISGWSRLAEYYPADDFADAEKRGFQSLSMGAGGLRSVNLNRCVTVGAGPRGLHLAMFFFFRPGHAPLLIPFRDISAEVKKVFFFDMVALRTMRAPEIELVVSRSLARWIEEKSGGLWRAPADAPGAAAATRSVS